MPIRLQDDVQVTIRAMRTGGFTTHQIAKSLGVSLSTVSKYCFTINEERGHKRASTRQSRQHFTAGVPQPGSHSA
jgi:predicted transcriptional regulator